MHTLVVFHCYHNYSSRFYNQPTWFSHLQTSSMFFHSPLIPSLSTPFTLTSPKQIRFTSSFKPNLLHICLHLAHHPDLHPISKRHALPRSAIRFSLNTIRSNQLTIAFASLSLQKYSIQSLLLPVHSWHSPHPRATFPFHSVSLPNHYIQFGTIQVLILLIGPLHFVEYL